MGKTLNWYLRRHPLLYKIRYQLVSKTVSLETIENFCYNDLNQKTNIPPLFSEINHLIFSNEAKDLSDFEKAEKIAIWLKKNVKGGPGLGKSSAVALQKMINGEGGVCSDFSQIYSNFLRHQRHQGQRMGSEEFVQWFQRFRRTFVQRSLLQRTTKMDHDRCGKIHHFL